MGRNSKLLLNVPPARNGLLHPTDAERLLGMRARLDELFAEGRVADPGGGRPVTVGLADLREDITRGQCVARYVVEGQVSGRWQVLSRGTTIGYRKLDRFAPVAVTGVRARVEESIGEAGPVAIRVYGQGLMPAR